VQPNKSPIAQLVFIFRYCGRIFWQTNGRLFLLLMFINIIPSLVIVPNLLLDKLFFDTIINNLHQPLSQAVVKIIIWIVVGRFSLALIRALSNRLSGYYARKFYWQLWQKTEVIIGKKYATVGVPTIEDPKFKDRYQKIDSESRNRLQTIAQNFILTPQYITGIFSSLSLFFLGQPWIVILSLASLIPTIWIDRIFIKRGYELETSIMSLHRKRSLYSNSLANNRSYLESRLLNIFNYLGSKITDIWQEIITKRLRLERRKRFGEFLAGVVDDAVSYSFDGVFAIQALLGQISVGTLQAYIRAISSFKSSVSSLTTAFLELYENYLYVSDLVWFLELDTPYFNSLGKNFPIKISQGIDFKDVWFKYPQSEEWILKGVSFHIDPAQNIAIVGENGAGKTTLIKLMCGFYTPTKGEITIDGISVSNLNKPDYWHNLSVLFQEFDVYGVTVGESIGIGDVSRISSESEVAKYAKLSEIDEWINTLPLKYNNSLYRNFDKGVSPSAGQWQRIGIARTLFKQAPIIILDEPTSNVDPKAEEEIFNQILKLGQKKNIIFISHRFSTVRRADKIIVISGGSVSEQGNHDQLINKKGQYAKLFQLQAKNYQ